MQDLFFQILRAGLWECFEVRVLPYGDKVDYNRLLELAEEQSVVGLLAAGIERIVDQKPDKMDALLFVGEALQIEQQNTVMNEYLKGLFERLCEADVGAVLVKGQGIAQCYERPFWRTCGDIDLLLDEQGYERAKRLLVPLAVKVDKEYTHLLHLNMTMPGGTVVELHGTMRSRLSARVDKGIDAVQAEMFAMQKFRRWQNGDVTVLLPAVDEDVVFVFTHILHHFFIEGIGLRQICDWCRLLWRYRSSVDIELLEQRLRRMGLLTEWRALAALAVDWLGMPSEAMPLFADSARWHRKGNRMMFFVLETGNFGTKRAKCTHSGFIRKIRTFLRRGWDSLRFIRMFPVDAVRFWWGMVKTVS